MTFYIFRLLDARTQTTFALLRGRFLAQRRQGGQGVNLYHMPDTADARGFFVGLGHDEQLHRAVVLGSFRNIGPLEGYVAGVKLPQEWG